VLAIFVAVAGSILLEFSPGAPGKIIGGIEEKFFDY